MTGLTHTDELTTKPLFSAESRKYIKNTEGGTFNSDDVEEEMSSFFADLMFERMRGKDPHHAKKQPLHQFDREMQSLSIEEIKKLLLEDGESEESELF